MNWLQCANPALGDTDNAFVGGRACAFASERNLPAEKSMAPRKQTEVGPERSITI
jgi:hypothetical protein